MKELLPVVKEEVGYSLAHYMGSKIDREFIKDELKSMKRENPVIAHFIKKWSKLDSHSIHSAFCGILVYKLLRSQAEADHLNDLLF